MFCLKEFDIYIENSDLQEYDQNVLHEFLKGHGFVFPENKINH